MKITNQLSIATLVLAGVFATGCSQQSAGGSQVSGGSQQQVEGGSQVQNAGGSQQASSQQQVEAPAPVVAAPAPTATPVSVPAAAPAMKPKPQGNRWTHTHPAIPNCTKSVRHTHKYNSARHSHKYGCRPMAAKAKAKAPQVDVRALQTKLKAKGYYKGPIDGVVGPATRSALQRFMQR